VHVRACKRQSGGDGNFTVRVRRVCCARDKLGSATMRAQLKFSKSGLSPETYKSRDTLVSYACGEHCINRCRMYCQRSCLTFIIRLLHVECVPQRCPCGTACTNQRFQRREYCKTTLFKVRLRDSVTEASLTTCVRLLQTTNKGYGLLAGENIRAGTFVLEYVGEVITTDECLERLATAHAEQQHFYYLTISGSLALDAGHQGNDARFVNHSCAPNCETQKWQVTAQRVRTRAPCDARRVGARRDTRWAVYNS
jgi:hypothetical protein